MKTRHYCLATLKETPAEAELISHQLMLRAGMIRQVSAGLYNWLPLGLRVLNKVANIVRDEMDKAGCQEILMPAIQPAELWQQSARWEAYGKELLRITDRHDREYCFGPTHEEVISSLASRELRSYKQLPQTWYQIQTKFRDEIRPRFGVMRSREFLMKDAYSFSLDQAGLQAQYDQMFQSYQTIFTRLGLEFRAVKADSGEIGGDTSHEFHVLAASGEDEIAYCPDSDYAANTEVEEVKNAKDGDPSPCGKGSLKIMRGIEVGHIFQIGNQKYSVPMDVKVQDQSGKPTPLWMGCYGIGISRVVAACIEQNHDDRGIVWPEAMAPFDVAIIPIMADKNPDVAKAADQLYADLQKAGYQVLLDDRDDRPGVKFADMDLIGIPKQIIIGPKTLAENKAELKIRQTGETTLVLVSDILGHCV
jgi:prolyl-tRNA synthetase